MLEQNAAKILAQLTPNDLVLDIGGWACPFNRANWVMDSQPYETRGFYETIGMPRQQGGAREHFTVDTWVQRDICDREPFPFADRQFDFVICSHTLEDVRDPLWVCSEMIRVGKRGYIEVPSRVAESARGWEHHRIAGLSHHRWLIDVQHRRIEFLHKNHCIHSHWRFSLPRTYLRNLPEDRKVRWLFWEDSFEFSERMIHGLAELQAELEQYVQSVRPYNTVRLEIDGVARRTANFAKRFYGGIVRRLRRVT
jgi:hypothetical protein